MLAFGRDENGGEAGRAPAADGTNRWLLDFGRCADDAMPLDFDGTRPAEVARAGVDDDAVWWDEEEVETAKEDEEAADVTWAPTVGPAGRQIFRRADEISRPLIGRRPSK